MRNLRRVVWSRGMFLTPQHFQALDNWIDETAQFRFTASNFANWGVLDLSLDEESLRNGLCRLRACKGILPDGTVFSIPAADVEPTARQLAKDFTPDRDHLDVFLCLPDRVAAAKNFTQATEAGNGTAITRYIAETSEIVDENGYGEAMSVQFGRKNFKLLFGSQNLDGFVTLQIARIIRDGNEFALDSEFVAPCVDIISSGYLMEMLRRQIEILVSRGDALNASLHQKMGGLADFGATDVGIFWFLHTVNTSVPQLQHIWDVRHGHPESLWVAMLTLAGALATFSPGATPRDLPSYDHRDLGSCFTALDNKIRGLLETVIRSKCVSIPLRRLEKSLWTGTVSNDDYFKTGTFFLAVSAKTDVAETIKKVLDLVKLSPSDEIQKVINYALPGVKLHHEPTPPSSITFKLHNQYFSFNQAGPLWERITQTRNFSLFVPHDIGEATPEVLVVLQ